MTYPDPVHLVLSTAAADDELAAPNDDDDIVNSTHVYINPSHRLTMFKSAAARIAHNSTLPALGASKDLRPLQDLITAEKAVMQSLQRLSADFVKSNECLKAWGFVEGDDLADTLSASQQLLSYVAAACAQLASHQQTVREYMKGVRSREENLDEMRKRRKNTMSRADTAEKKLSKMSPEHKSLQQQTELLNSLRDQIRTMDWDIMCEEARLGDFKRTSTKNWMMLKFGGLLECAEKATIVGELGKLVIEEIPLDQTQPGQARAFYAGHDKTDKLLEEARRCLSEVVFDPQPASESPKSPAFQQPSPQQQQHLQQLTHGSQHPRHPGYPEPSYDARSPQVDAAHSGDMDSGYANRPSHDYFAQSQQGSPVVQTGDPYGHRAEYSQNSYASQHSRNAPSADEFGYSNWRGGPDNAYTTMPGGPPRHPQQYDQSGSNPASPVAPGPSSGGHFATLPVGKGSTGFYQNQGYALQTQQSHKPLDDSTYERGRGHERDAATSFSADVENALSTGPRLAVSHSEANAGADLLRGGTTSSDGPLPRYESHYDSPIVATGLPKGAAPPRGMGANPWSSSTSGPQHPQHPQQLEPPALGNGVKDQRSSLASDGSSELPYVSEESDGQQQRHVRFGGRNTIDDGYGHDDRLENGNGHNNGSGRTQIYKDGRDDLGNDAANQYPRDSEYTDDDEVTVLGPSPDREEGPGPQGLLPTDQNDNSIANPNTDTEISAGPVGRCSPPPEPNARLDAPAEGNKSVTDEHDEAASNAAAASEVAKEMDSLPSARLATGVPPVARTPSPLVPPAPPFAQQQNIEEYKSEAAPFSQSPPKSGTFGGSTLPPLPPGVRSTTPPADGQPEVAPQTSRSALGLGLPGAVPVPSTQISRASSNYGTPPEYPSSATGPSFRGPPSLPSSPPLTPMTSGARTISASAFKRPQSRSPGGSDTNFGSPRAPLPEITPLSIRGKPLPSVGPAQEGVGGSQLASAPSQQPTQVEDSPTANESFEYLASMVDYSASPQGAGQSVRPPPAGAAQGHAPGEIPTSTSAGYGSGKFSTNLEDLR